MQVVYYTNVTNVGPMVQEFLGDGMMILFKEGAPDELRDYCVLHDENRLVANIQVGHWLLIGNMEYKVTAVGSAVNENLGSLGHITIAFNGSEEADLPGTLCVETSDVEPRLEGETIKIIEK